MQIYRPQDNEKISMPQEWSGKNYLQVPANTTIKWATDDLGIYGMDKKAPIG